MEIKQFALERYFAKYEFSVKYLLSPSDCDGLAQSEVLSWADAKTKNLWDNLKLGYTESAGLPLLRKEIAKLYQTISAGDVLVIAPGEGIFITLNILLNQGNHVICTWPGYQSLYEIAESLNCKIERLEPSEKEGWKFDPVLLEKSIKPKTKLIILNFPHNPTGSLPSQKDFQAIIDIAMYRFLELNPEERLSAACEVYEKAISLFGMSKTFVMAGIRIGWLVTKDKKLRQQMAEFKDYTTICSSAPSEILALIALRAKEKIIERHLTRINRNLALFDNFFQNHKTLFSWTRPKAGTISFPKILFDEDSLTFCERVFRDASVMLLPSTVYGYDDKHFRVGFGRKNMPEALEVFEKYLKDKF